MPNPALLLIPLLLALAALWWLRRLRHDRRLVSPSLFTAIGFPIADQGQITDYVNTIARDGRPYPVAGDVGGSYFQLSLPEGVEFWTAVNTEQQIEAVAPYFRASNRNALRILQAIPDEEWRYEGVFEAEVAAGGRLVFACPDFLLHAGGSFPQEAEIALAGFVHEAEVWADEAAFCAAQGYGQAPIYACTPAGLLALGKAPACQALIRGLVKDGRALHNSKTGQEFIWAQVRAGAVMLDLVADPRLLKAAPEAGSVVEVSVWLTGDWVEHR